MEANRPWRFGAYQQYQWKCDGPGCDREFFLSVARGQEPAIGLPSGWIALLGFHGWPLVNFCGSGCLVMFVNRYAFRTVESSPGPEGGHQKAGGSS